MRWKLLIGGVLLFVVLGAGAAAYYRSETEPVEKRGSAKEEFDGSAEPAKEKPPARSRSAEGWPTFGYDLQRSKVSPYDHRPPFRRTWRIDAHDTLEFPPSAAYGNVYIAQQKGLFFALDGKTGRKVFPRKNFKRCAASSPTIANGTIYQSYMDFKPCPQGASRPTGFVTAINAKTGRERWRFRAQPIESSPLLRKGILYVGSWDHNVYAISARTGKKIWSFRTDDRVNTSPAYSKGRIFIATNGGSLYALNARTGKLAWRAQSQSRFGSREFFYAAPSVAYGRVFIGNTDGTMYAFGQRSGNLLWAHPLGTYIYSAAAIYKRRVFVGTYDGNFFALDAATGDTRWRRGMPSAVHAAPVVMAGIVYASSCSSCGSAASRSVKTGKDSTIGFATRNGHVRWRNNGGKYASPIIADRKRVYFTGRSYLYGLEPKRSAGRGKGTASSGKRERPAGRRAAGRRKRGAAARRRATTQRRATRRRAVTRRKAEARRKAATRRRAATRKRRRDLRRERSRTVRPHPTTLPRWW